MLLVELTPSHYMKLSMIYKLVIYITYNRVLSGMKSSALTSSKCKKGTTKIAFQTQNENVTALIVIYSRVQINL